jgi:hypothetical protein
MERALPSLLDDPDDMPTAPGISEWPDWAHDPDAEGEPILEDPSSWDDTTKPFVVLDDLLPSQ